MNVLLERPGMPTRRFKIAGDQALVGRAPHCDVVIEEEFVSKQHLLLLRGVVAIDQSTNGTFLDGKRIAPAALLGTHAVSIAQTDITIRVEPEEPDAPAVADDSAEQLRQLRSELESMQAVADEHQRSRKAAVAAVEAEARRATTLQHENQTLRTKIQELEQRLKEASLPAVPSKPADDSPVSMLIFKLQKENAELKRALLQRAPAVPAASPPANAGDKPEPPAPLPPGLLPPAKDAPRAAAAKPGAPADPSAKLPTRQTVGLTRLSELVQLDADALPLRKDDALDAFLMAEGYRFLRRIEKVVSRIAGGLIQLLQEQTMVPGVDGNLRDFLRTALSDPDRVRVREGLLGYLREMGRWMVASVYAYRQAAETYVDQLKKELSAEALMAQDPMSVAKKLTTKSEVELWRRACTHLRELKPERVRERLEKMAREAAEKLVNADSSNSFG